MKSARRVLGGLVLTNVALAGVAGATETHTYPGISCVPLSGGGVFWESTYLSIAGPQNVYCPVLLLKNASVITEAKLWTSSGVNSNEVVLLVADEDGDFVASRGPNTTTTVGDRKLHTWTTDLAPENPEAVSIRVSGANGDKIHGYAIADSAVSY